jgi:hypothetical protein
MPAPRTIAACRAENPKSRTPNTYDQCGRSGPAFCVERCSNTCRSGAVAVGSSLRSDLRLWQNHFPQKGRVFMAIRAPSRILRARRLHIVDFLGV